MAGLGSDILHRPRCRSSHLGHRRAWPRWRIIYNDARRDAAFESESGAEFVDKEALLREADFLTLHVPLLPETRHYISSPRASGSDGRLRVFQDSRSVHGERMVKRTFDPGFRIALHQKDLNLALTTAHQMGLSLPNTATCQELFNSCAAHGGGAWDHSRSSRRSKPWRTSRSANPPDLAGRKRGGEL